MDTLQVKLCSACGPPFSTFTLQRIMVAGVASTTEPASVTTATQPSAARSASTGVNATLQILDLLAARGPLGLAALARELGVAKSTAHRVCAVLVERAWAVRDADGRYHLGVPGLRLGAV